MPLKQLLSFILAVFFVFPLIAMEQPRAQIQVKSWADLPREMHMCILQQLIALYERDQQWYRQHEREIRDQEFKIQVAQSLNHVEEVTELQKSNGILAQKEQIFAAWKNLSIYRNVRNYLSICKKCLPWRADKDFMKPLIEDVKEESNNPPVELLWKSATPEQIMIRRLEYTTEVMTGKVFTWHTVGAIEWGKQYLAENPALFQYIQKQIDICPTADRAQGLDFYCFPEPWLAYLQHLGFTIPFLADGKTSLMRAVQKNAPADILENIHRLRCCDVNAQDTDGNTALQLALLAGHAEVAFLLIENCQGINLQGVDVGNIRQQVTAQYQQGNQLAGALGP